MALPWRFVYGNIGIDGTPLPSGTDLAVLGWDDSGQPWNITGKMVEDGRIGFSLPSEVPGSVGLNATITAPGCVTLSIRMLTPGADVGAMELTSPETKEQYSIVLTLGPNSFRKTPSIPTRDQVCGVKLTFQGLTITTKQYGEQPWFELAYQCLIDPADRQSVRQQKRAAGDTHLILEYFTRAGTHIYDEPGQWLQPLQSLIGEDNPDAFRAMVEEVIADGFIPLVVFDGDNGDNPVDGYPNALRQLPGLVALLQQGKDLTPYVLFGRLWDGVFYGSSPDNIRKFGAYFRSALPNGYLAIEHDPGHIPTGGGPSDWLPGGTMDGYDVLMSEFNDSAYPAEGNDTIWQVVARCVRPYIRPADQPSGDDPSPPFYLVDSPRGPRFYCAFEYNYAWGAYGWVRHYCTAEEVAEHRAYIKTTGASYVC